MINTEIRILNSILRGGVREGNSIMFSGSFNDDHRILMHQFIFALLKQDYRVLLVEFKQNPKSLLKWLKEYKIDYNKFIEKEQLKIIDGHTNLYAKTQVVGKEVLSNPMDLPITTAILRRELTSKGYNFLVMDDLSILYAVLPSKDEFFKITVRFINSLLLEGIATITSFIEKLASPTEFSLLTLPFGYVISIEDDKVRIKKAPHPIGPVDYFKYIKTDEGIKSYEEHYESLEKIKESLYLDDEGILWNGNQRVQVIDEESEAKLIESLFEYYGSQSAKKFMYFWGREEFLGRGKLYLQIYRSLDKVLKRIIHDTKVTGGGTLEIGHIEEDIIIIRAKNLFPRIPNFGEQIHLHDVGGLTQIIEEVIGGKWEGDEVKCEAKGDSYCEFIIKRVSK